ncbi:hypothetical protein HYV87_02670, partial [Candidatus Woesearchaeota archaeon]|nr:hypothetical protein [Candidatus Woesearchaeota archaeon]
MSNQTGFINLFILLPLLVIATVAATLGISKVLDKNDKGVELANISEQIEQKENELEIAASSNSQETVSQELLKLKIELEKLKQPQATKAPVQKTQPPIITNTPVITQSSNQNLRIELSASRYSLPANGEAISFITAEIRDQNNKLAET